jgi:hypothetical protein
MQVRDLAAHFSPFDPYDKVVIGTDIPIQRVKRLLPGVLSIEPVVEVTNENTLAQLEDELEQIKHDLEQLATAIGKDGLSNQQIIDRINALKPL